MAGKPGYKETAMGWIPQEWRASKLEALVEKVGSGVTPKGGSESYLSSGIPLIRSQNIHWGRLSLHDVALISEAQHERMSNSALKPLDVLLNITGASIGRCAVLPSEFKEGNVNQHVCIIRPTESLQPHYLSQYLLSEFGQAQIDKLQAGGNREGLNYQQVRGFWIALPPLAEQQKIAAILTAIDDKLDLIARQISATQTLKQGLMQTLFTRGVGNSDTQGRWYPHTEFRDSPIGQIPQSWESRMLEDLATENITYGVVQPGEIRQGGVPLVRGGDIKNGKIADNLRTVSEEISTQFKRTVLQGGELLVSLVGYPGETAVVPEELAGANIARQAGMIRTKNLAMSKFIHFYFASPTGRACLLGGMIGSAQQVINLKAVREVYVPMPAEVERYQISAMCEALFDKLDTLTTKQAHYQSLKRGLMQKLLTGGWRVKVSADATA